MPMPMVHVRKVSAGMCRKRTGVQALIADTGRNRVDIVVLGQVVFQDFVEALQTIFRQPGNRCSIDVLQL